MGSTDTRSCRRHEYLPVRSTRVAHSARLLLSSAVVVYTVTDAAETSVVTLAGSRQPAKANFAVCPSAESNVHDLAHEVSLFFIIP